MRCKHCSSRCRNYGSNASGTKRYQSEPRRAGWNMYLPINKACRTAELLVEGCSVRPAARLLHDLTRRLGLGSLRRRGRPGTSRGRLVKVSRSRYGLSPQSLQYRTLPEAALRGPPGLPNFHSPLHGEHPQAGTDDAGTPAGPRARPEVRPPHGAGVAIATRRGFMNPTLSGWTLGLGFVSSLFVVIRIISEEPLIVTEAQLRLLSLTLGVPIAAVLAFEGIVSGWVAGGIIGGVVTFATKPWKR